MLAEGCHRHSLAHLPLSNQLDAPPGLTPAPNKSLAAAAAVVLPEDDFFAKLSGESSGPLTETSSAASTVRRSRFVFSAESAAAGQGARPQVDESSRLLSLLHIDGTGAAAAAATAAVTATPPRSQAPGLSHSGAELKALLSIGSPAAAPPAAAVAVPPPGLAMLSVW